MAQERDIYSAMQEDEPLARYKKTILGKVHVIALNPFTEESEGVILQGVPNDPAYFETAGMVLIEALSLGLPVLVTASCGYAFHVAKAQAGKVIEEPFSQAQMNHSLEALLNPDLLQQLSYKALDYAKTTDLYSMDSVICRSLIERPKS